MEAAAGGARVIAGLRRAVRDAFRRPPVRSRPPVAMTDQRPYQCPNCGHRFASPEALARHERFRHGRRGVAW